MKLLERLVPFVISLLATPLALFAGLVSVGMGHGNYLVASMLFPFAFLTAITTSPLFACPEFGDCEPRDTIIIASAVLQFPFYGLLFSLIDKQTLLAIFLAIVHLCFFVGYWLYIGTLAFF